MATERLVNSTEELKQGLGAIDSDIDFDAIKSFVDDAENNHIIPAIGYPMYDALREATLSDKQTRALFLLQKAIANFTIHYFTAFGAVRIGAAGIMVKKDNNNLPASDKKTYQLRAQSRADGFRALESAINYLETYPLDFAEYITDDAHKRNRANYINTTTDFSQGFELTGNSEVFQNLRSVMDTVERNNIDPLLGDTLSTALRSAILANNISDPQKELLKRIAKATALLTITEAIPYRLINIDASGLITATIKGNTENVETTTEGDLKRLQGVMNVTLQRGNAQIAALTKWLNANAADFPDYVTNDLSLRSTINNDERGFFFA